MDEMIGRKIDKYTIRQHLGRGGMGAVYLAEHEERGGYAVKFLLPEPTRETGFGQGVVKKRGAGRCRVPMALTLGKGAPLSTCEITL